MDTKNQPELSAGQLEQGSFITEREERFKEVESNRAKAIAEAEKAGTVIPLYQWDEPYQYKDMIVSKLCGEEDVYKAIAILDEVLERQLGKYVFYLDGRIGRNTTDIEKLKEVISDGVMVRLLDSKMKGIINDWLEKWKQQPFRPAGQQPCNGLVLPMKLDTPRARTAIERAIASGVIDRIPNGLKWRGVMGGKPYMRQLAYFSKLAWYNEEYDRTPTREVVPARLIDALFGVKHISKYVHDLRVNVHVKTPKWEAPIDALFKE